MYKGMPSIPDNYRKAIVFQLGEDSIMCGYITGKGHEGMKHV